MVLPGSTKGFTPGITKGITKEFTNGTTGCLRKLGIVHWFYYVVHEKYGFYIGFTRLSVKSVAFPLVLQRLSADNLLFQWFLRENSRTTRGQPGHGFATGAGAAAPLLPQNTPSTGIESPTQLRLASPARTHERNETISRLGVTKNSTPQPPIWLQVQHVLYIRADLELPN